jgi:hypothetical protein
MRWVGQSEHLDGRAACERLDPPVTDDDRHEAALFIEGVDELRARRVPSQSLDAVESTAESDDEDAAVGQDARLERMLILGPERPCRQLKRAQQPEVAQPPQLHDAAHVSAVHVGAGGEYAIDMRQNERAVRSDERG